MLHVLNGLQTRHHLTSTPVDQNKTHLLGDPALAPDILMNYHAQPSCSHVPFQNCQQLRTARQQLLEVRQHPSHLEPSTGRTQNPVTGRRRWQGCQICSARRTDSSSRTDQSRRQNTSTRGACGTGSQLTRRWCICPGTLPNRCAGCG